MNETLWKQKAEANTAHRLNWRKLFGTSLTNKITQLKQQGYTINETYQQIINEFPFLTTEAKERLRISISARYAEQNAMERRLQ